MISLFITCLLGFFCCSSINFNALEHTKDIELRENQYVKNAIPSTNNDGSLDFVYFFNSDFLSYEFAKNLVTYMAQNISSSWAGNQTSSLEYYFNNVAGSFWAVESNNFFQTKLVNVNRILVKKVYRGSYTIDSNDIYQNEYSVTLMNTSLTYKYLEVTYNFVGPIGFSGAFFSAITFESSQYLSGVNWSYYESTRNFAPIITLCYQPIYDGLMASAGFDNQYYETLGYNNGYNDGLRDGDAQGYQRGYSSGLIDGAEYDDIALTIFTGVIDIGLLPVNFFLSIMNFEVFGINIAGFVSSLLTIAIVIIVIRLVTGKKE